MFRKIALSTLAIAALTSSALAAATQPGAIVSKSYEGQVSLEKFNNNGQKVMTISGDMAELIAKEVVGADKADGSQLVEKKVQIVCQSDVVESKCQISFP